MGLKYTVETVGELRKALANVPDDIPFIIVCDDSEYVKFEVQSLHDREPERFVKLEAIL